MATSLSLSDLKPTIKRRIIDLVEAAGLDVSDWANFKKGRNPAKAAVNPKYCYEWAFVQREKIILNLWHRNLHLDNGVIKQELNMRKRAQKHARTPNEVIWKSRSSKADDAIQTAYKLQLAIRVIICDGQQRNIDDLSAKASRANKRLLDSELWAVTSYDLQTGDCVLERGAKPIEPANDAAPEDDIAEGFEGEAKKRYSLHRKREGRFRDQKIRENLRKNNGRLICEVPNCGFDFAAIYGDLGRNYAQVHHKVPLSEAPDTGRKVVIEDLAVVCANCHVMIHRGGECRPIESLISSQRKRQA